MVSEKDVPFYAHWVSKLLACPNLQVLQAEDALRFYLYHFLLGKFNFMDNASFN